MEMGDRETLYMSGQSGPLAPHDMPKTAKLSF